MSDDPTTLESAALVTDGAYLCSSPTSTTPTPHGRRTRRSRGRGRQDADVEGVLVVKRDDDGTLHILKSTDHSTRKGLTWGVVGGVALGIIFPPTILGSAAALGAVGAAAGKGVALHHRKELTEDLQDSIAAGHSGLVALVSDPSAVALRKALDKSDAILEKAIEKARPTRSRQRPTRPRPRRSRGARCPALPVGSPPAGRARRGGAVPSSGPSSRGTCRRERSCAKGRCQPLARAHHALR